MSASDYYQNMYSSTSTAPAWIGSADSYATTIATNAGLENAYRTLQEYGSSFTFSPSSLPGISRGKTITMLKKSVKEIKTEKLSTEKKKGIRGKIDELKEVGLKKAAVTLEAKLKATIKLARIAEWNYKVLPYKEVQAFNGYDQKTDTTYRVHIDKLENYEKGIPPQAVIKELKKAKDRQVFDEFEVLWVEKIPDPILLGKINECKDYFFISEWGNDISYDEIMKNNKEK